MTVLFNARFYDQDGTEIGTAQVPVFDPDHDVPLVVCANDGHTYRQGKNEFEFHRVTPHPVHLTLTPSDAR